MKLIFVQPKKFLELETVQNVNRHRKLDCIFYNLCLSRAAYASWNGFSCLECQMYYKDKEQILKDSEMEKYRLFFKVIKTNRYKLKRKE